MIGVDSFTNIDEGNITQNDVLMRNKIVFVSLILSGLQILIENMLLPYTKQQICVYGIVEPCYNFIIEYHT